ncbi:hypothetical protein B0H10DRAFT_2041165 [Mycena sp. CBHHK59/15]|nr:hypothetical protein B0H10DRAFT_2041165 [Mycena sp. CBHHK59/15]
MASESRDPNAHAQLLLTETTSESDVQQIQPGGPAVPLDYLGPMVVNSDGTLSRIANWLSMSEPEKEQTRRALVARNIIRLANEERKLKNSGESQATL